MKQDLKTVMKAIYDMKFNGGKRVEWKYKNSENWDSVCMSDNYCDDIDTTNCEYRYKLYCKLEEENMNEINNMIEFHEALIKLEKGEIEGIEMQNSAGNWDKMSLTCSILDYKHWMSSGDKFRIIPKPTYRPWTPDDWRKFSEFRIYYEGPFNYKAKSIVIGWSKKGIEFDNGDWVSYESLLKDGMKETGEPCGVEV